MLSLVRDNVSSMCRTEIPFRPRYRQNHEVHAPVIGKNSDLLASTLDYLQEPIQRRRKVVVVKTVNFTSSAFSRVLGCAGIKEEGIFAWKVQKLPFRLWIRACPIPSMTCDPLTKCNKGLFRESLRTDHRIIALLLVLQWIMARVIFDWNGLKDLDKQ